MIKISRSVRLSSTALFLLIIIAAPTNITMADSDNIDVTKTVDGAITIDAENLVELYHSMEIVDLIDSRLSEDRAYGYIESSYNLPVADTNCASLGQIVSDMDQPVVFYDNGIVSSASMIATSIAVMCGYNQLFWFRGGFAEWEAKDYPYIIR